MATSSGAGVTNKSEKLTFPCPKCQKRWTWKPEIAGKKVKCKCGGVFSVPSKPPGGSSPVPAPVKVSVPPPEHVSQLAPMTKGVKPPKQEDSLYGLSPTDEKPAPKPQQVVAEVMGPPPGKKAVGKIIGHKSRSIAARGEEEEGDKKKKLAMIFAVVAILFAVGMILWQFGYLDKILRR
jgi:predicted RNA-binding Zn-ribbon protein involved in translation (DUF1610 family)